MRVFTVVGILAVAMFPVAGITMLPDVIRAQPDWRLRVVLRITHALSFSVLAGLIVLAEATVVR